MKSVKALVVAFIVAASLMFASSVYAGHTIPGADGQSHYCYCTPGCIPDPGDNCDGLTAGEPDHASGALPLLALVFAMLVLRLRI